MTNDEINALTALCAAHGRPVYDPRWAMHPAAEEALLRATVRKVWREHSKHLPGWLGWYVRKWSGSAEGGEPRKVPGDICVPGVAPAAYSLPAGDRDGD